MKKQLDQSSGCHPHCCPLCDSDAVNLFYEDKVREYFRCENCHLISVPKHWHLSEPDEKAEYDLHCNSPLDAQYRNFLGRIFEPMISRLASASHGLDFGSGPGPTLSVMFQEIGHQVEIYDPFYARDKSVLNSQYDFVTASEVVEHFRNPKKTLSLLWSLVREGGQLAIMTKMALDLEAFSNWHYRLDPTHVNFFSLLTFEWIAAKWNVKLDVVDKDVVMFQKTISS